MPTRHPRHTVTEHGPVADAFARARRIQADIRAQDLIVLGADALEERSTRDTGEDERRRHLRERLLARVKGGGGLDLGALQQAREHGWARDGA